MDVRIDEVHTELVITEAVGPLSIEDTRKLLAMVMEHMRHQKDHEARKRADDGLRDRSYIPDIEDR